MVDGCDSLYQLFERNPKWFAECVAAQTMSYQQIRDKILTGRNTGIHDYSHMRARGKEAEYEMMCLSANLQVVKRNHSLLTFSKVMSTSWCVAKNDIKLR